MRNKILPLTLSILTLLTACTVKEESEEFIPDYNPVIDQREYTLSNGKTFTKYLNAKGEPDYSRIKRGSYKDSEYTAQKGDTLYYVSYITNLKIDDIARLNKMKKPYSLHEGMKLKLANVSNIKPQNDSQIDKKDLKTDIKTTKQEIINKYKNKAEAKKLEKLEKQKKEEKIPVTPKMIAIEPKEKAQVQIKTQQIEPKIVEQEKASVKTPIEPIKTKIEEPKELMWAATGGEILVGFGEGGSKGIEIKGHKNKPVRAANDGKVVFVGNALKGYGNLIIIKHDNDYITAYGYNEKILVQPEQMVKRGQRIASFGQSDYHKDYRLYFEVRKYGKAVNPFNHIR